jgi:hypothetical protein
MRRGPWDNIITPQKIKSGSTLSRLGKRFLSTERQPFVPISHVFDDRTRFNIVKPGAVGMTSVESASVRTFVMEQENELRLEVDCNVEVQVRVGRNILLQYFTLQFNEIEAQFMKRRETSASYSTGTWDRRRWFWDNSFRVYI